MTRSLVLTLLWTPLFAQFSQFAATDDGRQFYFTSSLPLAGDPTSFGEARIFRVAENGLEPFATSLLPATQSSGGATSPQVSGDGQTVGLTRDGNGELLGAGAAVLGPGMLSMSRNARWAVLTVTTIAPPPANIFRTQSTIVNLATGERTVFNFSQPSGTINRIASDGTVVLPSSSGPSLWRQGQSTPITLPANSNIVALSDDAQVLLYEQVLNVPTSPQLRLVARNLLAETETLVVAQSYPNAVLSVRAMSNDGQWLLYLVQGTAFVANTINGQSIPLRLPNGELASDGTLSGNGNLAFLETTAGNIVSMNAQTGAGAQTLVTAPSWVPNIGSVPEVLFPGSLVHLTGANLPATADAFVGRLFLDNIALPVVYTTAMEVAVQVPWELQAPGPSAFRVDLGNSPFRQNQWVPINSMFPKFEPLAPGETSVLGFKAVRGDFSSLLTSQPNSGDVIVVYATGLGPVNGPMITGQAAPVNSAIAIQGQFTCSFNPYGQPAETLFAGLAPGVLGIYQVNFRLPSGTYPGPITGGLCTYSGPGRNGGFTWYVPSAAGQ
jgi:uncharacterized protein (TIGR03437 family)